MIRAKPQRGYILLPVVLLITLVATSAFLLNNESALDTGMTASRLEAKRVEYVTKAGLHHALWRAGQQGCGPHTDLTNQPLDSHSYTTTLSTSLGSTSSYTISVDQDTWIRSDQPTMNYASDSALHIRFETGTIERPMYRYDLSPIAANSNILSATAWFYVSVGHPQGPVDIHLLTADWTGTDATWASMGANMDTVVQASIPAQPAAGVWVAVNLTSQVQAWVNGFPNNGITLNSISEGTRGDYASNEASQQPYMEVIVGTPPSAPATLQAVGTLSNGVSRVVQRDDMRLYQTPPGLLFLQPDAAAGKDASLAENSTTWNYGSFGLLRAQAGAGGHWRSPLQFDLVGLPFGARILSATLELYRTTGTQDAPGVMNVHAITHSWEEGNSSGSANPGVTWDDRDTSLPWTTPGGDYDATPSAHGQIDTSTDTWFDFDITSLVQQWVDGTRENNGMMLVAGDDVVRAEFLSSDAADPSLRPKLNVRYACECGSPCVASQGSGNILMVVADDSNLTAGERAKKALFEHWGYSVELIAQWDVDLNFDAKAVNNDVVYVSEAVASTTSGLAPKLAATSLGVVNEEGELNDELGLSSGHAWPVGDAIAITDASHYITQPFATGALQIYTAAMQGLTVSGSEAGGLKTLADWGGGGTLVVLETGAALDGGGTAAGRRVMLPLGRDGNFNLDYLTASGRLIVQRALAWAMGADKVDTGKRLLLVVANASSPTGEEDARKSLIESWGYPVALIDDSDTQANFDAALASNDVAYISSTASSVELGAKLTNATIGVVNENGSLVEELGFGQQSVDYRSDDGITVIDNTHYITQPLPADALTISVSFQNLHIMTADKAPGFDVLAEVYNTGTLYDQSLGVIDTGGQVFGGGIAAGRRVLLPWGDASFDVTALNSDGQTIMRRAIEWASTVPDPKTPLAHWKLDETSGITAVDSEGGHDGMLINGPVWTLGQIDGALGFDGNNDHVLVPDAPSLDIGTNITLSAWVKPAKTDTQYVIRKAQYSSTDGYELSLSSTGKSFFRLNQASSGDTYRIDSTSLYPNDGVSWMHIAGTYDGAVLRLYINGVEEASLNAIVGIGTNATDLSIGAQADGSGVIEGAIDDVKLFRDALSAEEVAALASGGSGGGAPGPDGCNGTFRDDFDTATWSGSSGTLDWSTSPWAEVGETDGAGNGDVSIIKDKGDSRLRIRDSQNGGEGVERVADLDGAATATLSLDYRRDGLDDSNDYVAVFLSTNGTAGPWDEIVRFQGADNDSKYQSFGQDISGYISAHTAIRLRSSTSLGDTDTVWFDNIQIECKP